ncbi:MAG: hypothetical protein GWN58_61310 [Anaerolineae bacterium]|nr:hypothetical protein [Anaerolineae bacterium]
MDKMIALGKLPAALKQLTEPVILTGLEALSRERDIARVRQLIEIAAPFGPEEMAATYNTTALLAKAAAGVGMPDVIRSAEEKAQIEKQRHEAMMQQQLAGPAIQAMAQGGE